MHHRELSSEFCDDLEWDGGRGGREAQEGGDICIHTAELIHVAVQQKLAQHCKTIILQ